jgi:cob(I)alamin adenosyltransferase
LKIYTKTGDKGETSLFGGERVSKDELRIEAYGTVDELNSVVGSARAFNDSAEMDDILGEIQYRLFVLGADLATPPGGRNTSVPRISGRDVAFVEKKIDEIEAHLDPLKSFILPGGSKTASLLHLARTVCRRAERLVVSLRKRGETSEETVIYLNRLSDFLFVLARYANKTGKVAETLWNPRSESDGIS